MAKKGWVSKMGETHPDFDLERVPSDKRMSWWPLLVMFLGYTAIIAPSFAGSDAMVGLTMGQFIPAIIVGVLIIALMMIVSGFIAKREGLSFGTLSRNAFGRLGITVPLFILGITTVGWLSVDSFMVGSMSRALLGGGTTFLHWGFFVGPVIILAIGAYAVLRGIHGPKWVAYVTVPVMAGLFIWVIVELISRGGGWTGIMAYAPPAPFSMAFGIMLVSATFITSGINCGDFVRYAKDWKGVVFGFPLAVVVMIGLCVFTGALSVIVLEQWGIADMALALGGVIGAVAITVAFIMVLNSAAPAIYEASIEIGIAFWITKHRIVLAVVPFMLVMACVIDYIGAPDFMFMFLPFLAATATAFGGVLWADYWMVNKGKYPSPHLLTRKINWVAVIVWLGASYFNWWTAEQAMDPTVGLSYGIPGLNGLILAFLLYWGIMRIWPPAPLTEEGT